MKSRAHDAPQSGILIAALSDVGQLRSINEDSFDSVVRSDGARLLIVADGMGGHRGGAVASREAVATITTCFADDPTLDPDSTLSRAIERANDRVFSLSCEEPELAGMGTTVVAFLLDAAGRGTVAHVGDSRAYRWRGGRLEALTVDHSVVAEMLRRGVLTAEEAAFHPRRNEILRSVGVLPEVEAEVAPVEVAAGDWFLLCSDGLCGVASEAEIEEVLASTTSVDEAVAALVALANECGGPDNVTVQILAIPPARTEGAKSTAADASSSASASRSGAGLRAAASPPEADPRHAAPVAAAVIAAALLAVGAYWLSRAS